jgi:hypothetical protein
LVAAATAAAADAAHDPAMTPDEIQSAIDRAIRDHEIRVAFWSGLMGAMLLFGTWHAIWLLAQNGTSSSLLAAAAG